MRGAWVVHNPAAGRFPAESQVRRAADVFSSAGWSVHFETAARRDDLHDLVLRAADAGAEVLVVAGGDGTVGLAASLLRGSDTALAVLPTGTANVWARELGTPPPRWSQRGSLELIAERLVNRTSPARRQNASDHALRHPHAAQRPRVGWAGSRGQLAGGGCADGTW
ncbi:MAG: diacylglycerol kinase catalytic region [Anaerolineales bacterium]|nr:diacylglycerol kinase catalytic region [Anaerolineales bacterium]